eukprot:TRINITY_DN3988_c2_g1_i1.p1 TRINITY_DN3988_c2_g1~~TRINITY_DN3988_c2_g1_i1.p1  ORF type:complete len:1226 (-),score=278.45 TRINITY_DN3988_c2_g1_i1:30-3608(-)
MAPPAEMNLHRVVSAWPFAFDDPSIRTATGWLRARRFAKGCLLKLLQQAVEGGNDTVVRGALRLLQVTTASSEATGIVQPAIVLKAQELCVNADVALHCVGAITLGAEPEEILLVAARTRELSSQANIVKDVVASMEANRFQVLRSIPRPPRIVHGVLQLVAHAVAGVNPNIRNPPRDTEWRSCQRMMSNPKLLLANMASLPDWLASGHEEGAMRAKQLYCRLKDDFGQDFTVEAVLPKSVLAAQLLEFMESLFDYFDLLQESDRIGAGHKVGAGLMIQDVPTTSKNSMKLKEVLMDVDAQREKQRVEQPDLEVPRSLCVLQRAREGLGGNALLATGWMAIGGEASCLQDSLTRVQTAALATRVVACVSAQVLSVISRSATSASPFQPRMYDRRHGHLNTYAHNPRGSILNLSPARLPGLQGRPNQAPTAPSPTPTPIQVAAKDASSTDADLPRHAASSSNAPPKVHGRGSVSGSQPVRPQEAATKDQKSISVGHSHSAGHAHAKMDPKNQEEDPLTVMVKLFNGEALDVIKIRASATGLELKQAISVNQGVPVGQQRLYCSMQQIQDDVTVRNQAGFGKKIKKGVIAVVYLLRMSRSLVHRLEEANSAVSRCLPADFDTHGPHGRLVCEPAAMLLNGPNSSILGHPEGVGNPGDGIVLQARMIETLKAALEVLQNHSNGVCQQPAGNESNMEGQSVFMLRTVCKPVRITEQTIRGYQVPEANLAAAARSLLDVAGVAGDPAIAPRITMTRVKSVKAKDANSPPQSRGEQSRRTTTALGDPNQGSVAVRLFVEAMEGYYSEFMPQRAATAAAATAAAEAEAALDMTQEAVKFASSIQNMNADPDCKDVADVEKVAAQAAEQLVELAGQGLSLAAPHVEYVRRGIDSAGRVLLASPPLSEPSSRLRWAEAAMSVQLSPLSHMTGALSAIARLVDHHQILIVTSFAEPPGGQIEGGGFGAERLMAALAWVVHPNCNCDLNWEQSLEFLRSHDGFETFPQKLASWQLLRDANLRRMLRAKDILLETWPWVAGGCGGYHVLSVLFSWLSLAVALLPMAEISQRLAPVHRVIRQGLARVNAASDDQKSIAAGKAWTASLFLLDGTAEAFWWLGLIRPLQQAREGYMVARPWTDSEDGGVGAATPVGGEGEEVLAAPKDIAGPEDNSPTSNASEANFALEEDADKDNQSDNHSLPGDA